MSDDGRSRINDHGFYIKTPLQHKGCRVSVGFHVSKEEAEELDLGPVRGVVLELGCNRVNEIVDFQPRRVFGDNELPQRYALDVLLRLMEMMECVLSEHTKSQQAGRVGTFSVEATEGIEVVIRLIKEV